MKATAYIVMYSGMPDPSKELTDTEGRKFSELLAKAEIKSDRTIPSMLGPLGYRVIWSGDGPWVYVHVYRGIIGLSCYGIISWLKDTVGLEKYLEDLLGPALQKHHEEVLRISEQTKV